MFGRYAGEIFGISNTLATIPGMVAPNIVNAMTPNVSYKLLSLAAVHL